MRIMDEGKTMEKACTLRIGSKQRGFTLIELMIVVVIIAILAAIAYPSYTRYLVQGRRSSAEAHLMDIAQSQQRYLLDARSYAADVVTLNVPTPSSVSP